MRLINILIFLLSSTLHAQNFINSQLVKEVKIDKRPQFFFKVSSDGKLIGYSIKEKHGPHEVLKDKNYILRASGRSRGTSFRAPGAFDPVFIPGTYLIVAPESNYMNFGLEVWDINKVISRGIGPNNFGRYESKVAVLNKLKGTYQSVGILEENSGSMLIRIIADKEGKYLADYEYDKASGVFNPEPIFHKPFCHNLDTMLKLPMLSKDGRLIAGYNISTRTTIVYSIKRDGRCVKFADLGRKTGKVNFNYDNSEVVYHIYGKESAWDSVGATGGRYIQRPDAKYVADIYAYNFKSKKTTRLSMNRNMNSLYPDFIKNGEIVVINYPHDESNNVSFSFIRRETPDFQKNRISILKKKRFSFVRKEASDFQKKGISLLKERCFSCHGNQSSSSGINLEDPIERKRHLSSNSLESNYVWEAINYDLMPIGMPLSDLEKDIMKKLILSYVAK